MMKALLVCLLIPGALAAQTIADAKHAIESEFYFKAKTMLLKMNATAPSPEVQFYLGEVYFTEGKPDSAKYYYQKAAAVEDTKNAMRYLAAGKYDLLNKNGTSAKTNFDAALKVSKNKNAEIMYLIGDAYNDAGDQATTTTYFDMTYTTDPALVINLLAYGDLYLSKDVPEQAMTKYEQAKALDPNIAVTHLRIARMFSKTGKHKEAIDAYKEAVRLDPNLAIAWKELGEEHYLNGDFDQVKPCFDKYVSLNADDKEARIVPAVTCYQIGNFPCAIEEATKIVADDPQNFVGWRIIYFANYELGDTIRKTDPAGAAEYFKAGYEAAQKFWNIADKKVLPLDYQYSARLAVDMKDTSKAIFYYNLAMSNDTTRNYEIASEYAKYLYNIKKYTESIEAYKLVVEQFTAGALDYYFLARGYYQTADYVNADTVFAKFIELQPNSPDGYLQRAKTKVRLDGFDERGTAIPYYTKFIELGEGDPARNKKNLVEAYLYCFSFYDLIKQPTDACTFFNKAKALDPENPDIKEFESVVSCG